MISGNLPEKETVNKYEELKGLQPSFDRCEACGRSGFDGWCLICCSAVVKIFPFKAHFKMFCPFCPKSVTIGRPENSRRPGYDCFTMMRHVGKYCKGTAEARKWTTIKSQDVAEQLPQLLRLTKSVYNSKAAEAMLMDIDDGDDDSSFQKKSRAAPNPDSDLSANEQQCEPLAVPFALSSKSGISWTQSSSTDEHVAKALAWQNDIDEHKSALPLLEGLLEEEESCDLSSRPYLDGANTIFMLESKLPDESFLLPKKTLLKENSLQMRRVEKGAERVGQDMKLATTAGFSSHESPKPLSSHILEGGEESTSTIITDIGTDLSQLNLPNFSMTEDDTNQWF